MSEKQTFQVVLEFAAYFESNAGTTEEVAASVVGGYRSKTKRAYMHKIGERISTGQQKKPGKNDFWVDGRNARQQSSDTKTATHIDYTVDRPP